VAVEREPGHEPGREPGHEPGRKPGHEPGRERRRANPGPGIRLTVIGAGPAYSDLPGSAGACYLVEAAPDALVLDLGHGAFPGLVRRIEPARLQAVVVSHLHPDHFVDLVPMRHYLRYHRRPPERVRVLAPGALSERLDALHGTHGFCTPSLDVEPLAPGTRELGVFTLEAGRVTHDGDSFGFRVSVGQGPGLVYSGDCGVADDLRPLIRPGDTLLCEVSFGPGPVEPAAQHLDGPMVGRLASATGAGRVLLTHLLMGCDRDETLASVRARFDGPVELVDPGFETTIG
jgi:ribonuclease BN (tRNA processing enzyme)